MRIFQYALFFLCTGHSIAQISGNFRFINFGIQDGLPEKYIYSVAEDIRGYLWFGTYSGLYRYDGVSFKYFKSTANRPGGTIGNILQAVYCDSAGHLWLGSLNDLQWYNPVKNVFWIPKQEKSNSNNVSDSYIFNFFEDSHFNIWICTANNYLYRFNTLDSSFVHYKDLFPTTASKGVYKIIESKNGQYFSIHNEGIYEFNFEGCLINSHIYPGNQITNAFYDSMYNKILLTTLQKGIVEFHLVSNKFENFPYNEKNLKENHLLSLTKDKENNFWVGSYPLIKINGFDYKTELIATDYTSDYNFKGLKIGNIYIDKSNNIWLCTYNGLSMLPWQNQQIQTFKLTEQKTQQPIEPLGIISLPETNEVLIPNSSTSGLAVFNLGNKKLKIISNPFYSNKLNSPIVRLVQTKDKIIYASDDRNFFRYLDKEQKLIPLVLHDQFGKPIQNIGKFVYDRTDYIYIHSYESGCYIWNTKNGVLKHINRWDIDPQFADKSDNTLIPCLVDSKGYIWFTSNPGLYCYDPSKNSWTHFNNQNIPAIQTAYYMEEDYRGHLWITTINNGLFELYFDDNKPIISNYNKESNIGLPTDYLLKIQKDLHDHTLWIASPSGLFRFDPKQKRLLSIIEKQQGLSANDMRYGFTITKDNLLIALHFGALDIVNLNQYKFNSYSPPVVFNSIKVQDREMINKLQNPKLSLSLNHTENFLAFEFASLNFNNSNQTRYFYKLENIDKDWVSNDKRNYISFSGLQPGNYLFKVKAINNDGVWSYAESVFKFKINPAIWNTWWFRLILLLFLSGGIFSFYRYRIESIKHEEKLKQDFNQQITDMEMRALRAQMNPHFIFNSLNSIQKYILKNDHFAASQYLTKFSRLIRLILDHSNQNYIPISSEIELLNLYIEMESLRFDNAFQYSIKVDPLLSVETLEIPSMLIQPYVENAIWHGLLHKETQGNLTIEFKNVQNDLIQVIIEDDGIGREKAKELKSKQILKKKSYGMQITEDRILLINKINLIHASCEIQDLKENEQSIGTRVILNIPFKIVAQ